MEFELILMVIVRLQHHQEDQAKKSLDVLAVQQLKVQVLVLNKIHNSFKLLLQLVMERI